MDPNLVCKDGSPLGHFNAFWDGQIGMMPSCFEHTVLLWVPVILFWITLPFEISKLIHGKRVTPEIRRKRLLLFLSREFGLLIMLIMSLIRAGAINTIENVSPAVMSGLILYPITVTALLTLSFLRHFWLASSSSKLNYIILCVFTVFGLPEFVTTIYYTKNGEMTAIGSATYIIQYISAIFSLITFGLNDPKSEKDTREWPEEMLSLPSTVTFIWLFRLLVKGYRSVLSMSDVFTASEDEQTSTTYRSFDENLTRKQSNSRNHKISDWGMIAVLARTFYKPVLAAAFLQLINALLVMVSPLVLICLMQFTANNDEPNWHGFVYVAILFCSSLIRSFANQAHRNMMDKFGVRARAAIVAAVYRKALSMSSEARREANTGEIMNLMAVDSMRFIDLSPWMQLLWSAILQVCVGLYIIYTVVGHSMWAGVGVLGVIFTCTTIVSKQMQKLQMKQLQYKDKRMKLLTEMLDGIKLVKLYAWETAFERLIELIRAKELKFLKFSNSLYGVIKMSYGCTNLLSCIAIFGVYCTLSPVHNITSGAAFTVITVFNIIYVPFTQLPLAASYTMMALASVSRLRKYFNREDLVTYVERQPNTGKLVELQNATFAWESDAKELSLSNVDFSVKPGQLMAIVGSVGSGKSSLINAVLGEMQKRTGRVYVNGSTAYIAQQAWIQNMTVRDNILFGLPYDDRRYKEVIRACSLEPDLRLFANGDMTVIGDRGANLSGGQKQRISLARAVYQNRDIYLLDDPLSAVDVHVGKWIFENVVGPRGLLKNKARIFVTHGIGYLPNCDTVCLMQDGKFLAKGSFEELAQTHEIFAKFLEENIMVKKEDEPSRQQSVISNAEELQRFMSRQMSAKSHTGNMDAIFERLSSIRSTTRSQSERRERLETLTSQNEIVEENEESDISKAGLKTYFRYARSAGIALALHGVFLFLASLTNTAANMWLQKWTDTVPEGLFNSSTPNFDYIVPYQEGIGVMGAIAVLQLITTIIFSIHFVWFLIRASTRIHEHLLQTILRAPVSFFDNTPSGRLSNRFGKDMNTIDNQIPMSLSAFMHSFIILICFAIPLVYAKWYLILIVVPLFALYVFLQTFYVGTSRQLRSLEALTRSKIYSHFHESIVGSTTIRAYNREARFESQSDRLVDVNDSVQVTLLASQRWLAIQLDFIGNLIIVAASLSAVLTRYDTLPGMVGLSLACAFGITDILNWGMQETTLLTTESVALERVAEYSEIKSEAEWTNEDPQIVSITKQWPAEGEVEFRNYSTSYQPGLPLVLRSFSAKIHAGEKIGVVGRTGAGKSSLTLALFRLIEPVDGTILIDNVNICDLGLHDLRKKLTIIPQEPVLFSGTLRQNIDPFEEHSDEAIFRALQLSHLTSFVETLSGGLSHEINEGGANLSVGQRQLLCLARSLLKKAKILVMDEATASVDAETDNLIQQTVREQFADCTVITIAHRLNTILDCDRVMVLEAGQLKEFDSPNSLIRNDESEFGRMVKEAGIRIAEDNTS